MAATERFTCTFRLLSSEFNAYSGFSAVDCFIALGYAKERHVVPYSQIMKSRVILRAQGQYSLFVLVPVSFIVIAAFIFKLAYISVCTRFKARNVLRQF